MSNNDLECKNTVLRDTIEYCLNNIKSLTFSYKPETIQCLEAYRQLSCYQTIDKGSQNFLTPNEEFLSKQYSEALEIIAEQRGQLDFITTALSGVSAYEETIKRYSQMQNMRRLRNLKKEDIDLNEDVFELYPFTIVLFQLEGRTEKDKYNWQISYVDSRDSVFIPFKGVCKCRDEAVGAATSAFIQLIQIVKDIGSEING